MNPPGDSEVARIHDDADWEMQKENFRKCYMDNNMTRKEAAHYMKEVFHFDATPRQWERKIKQWDFQKYSSREERLTELARSGKVIADVARAGRRPRATSLETIEDRNLRRFARREVFRNQNQPHHTSTSDAVPLSSRDSEISMYSGNRNPERLDTSVPQQALGVSSVHNVTFERPNERILSQGSNLTFRSEEYHGRCSHLKPLNKALQLFRLQPGIESDPLVGDLLDVTLDLAPSFEAVCYHQTSHTRNSVDGDNTLSPKASLRLNGGNFLIDSDLAAALTTLREASRSKTYWIDCLCLSKDDRGEIPPQAEFLAEIFARASTTYIWLDSSPTAIEHVFQFIQRVDWFRTKYSDALPSSDITRFIGVICSGYFSWCWSLVPMLSSHELVFLAGQHRVRGQDFLDAMSVCQSLASGRSSIFNGLRLNLPPVFLALKELSQYETFLQQNEPDRLRHLLQATAQMQSNDPRERIYAILSLTPTLYSSGIVMDYRIPAPTLFKQVVLAIIQDPASLAILCTPWAPNIEADLPSWVVPQNRGSWRLQEEGFLKRVGADLLCARGTTENIYAASGRTVPEWRIDETLSRLHVIGYPLTSISVVGDLSIEGNVPNSWLELGGWSRVTENPPEHLWRTLVANRDDQGRGVPTCYRRALSVIFQTAQNDLYLETGALIQDAPSAILREVLHRVQATVWGRRFIQTTIGNHGLVPGRARAGDLICILLGCNVPVVIRRVSREGDDGGHHFELIGECFLYGMMDGEGLKAALKSGIPKQEFELR